jgi:hypothetical protein
MADPDLVGLWAGFSAEERRGRPAVAYSIT